MLPLELWSVIGSCLKAFPPLKVNTQHQCVSKATYKERGLYWGEDGFLRKSNILQWTPLLLYGLSHYSDVYCFPSLRVFSNAPYWTERTACSEFSLQACIIPLLTPRQCSKATVTEICNSYLECRNISNKGYDKWQSRQEIIRLRETVWAIFL